MLYVNFISVEVNGGWEFQLDSRHPPYRYVTQEGRGAFVEIPHWSVFYYGSPLSSLSPPSQEMGLAVVNHCPALIFFLPMGLTSGPSHYFLPCFCVWRYICVFHIFFIISMGLVRGRRDSMCLLHPLKPGTAIGFWQIFFTKWRKFYLFLVF